MRSLKEMSIEEACRLGPDRECFTPKIKYLGPTLCVGRSEGMSTHSSYKTIIKLVNKRVHISCSCPMGSGCKHCRALAIQMVEKWKYKKDDFTPAELYREQLLEMSKSQLIDILVKAKYPNVVDVDDDDDEDDDEEDEEEDEEDEYEDDDEYDGRSTIKEGDSIYKRKRYY